MITNIKKVLVVDDEEDLTWSISKNLAKDRETYELICVNSGKEALNVLTQIPVNLVVTDIKMPDISGLDLLFKIKEKYSQTKVIVMTAYGSAEVKKEASRRGAIHYIEKPFEISELRELIMNALTEKKGFEGQVSDLHLSDIIQMNCLGHSTGSLVIEKDNERGIIYFDDGNIIHAEIGDWKGEDAFYEILSWQGGRFSQKKGIHAPRETISKSWQNLLLEGLRQLDETTPVSSDQKEAEKMKRVSKINSALNEIGKIHGVSLVAVVTPDGFPISSIITKGGEPKNYDISMITTAIPPGLKYAGTISKEINGGEMKLLTVEFEDVLCLAGNIPNREEVLFVIAQPTANLGAIRLEVRKQGIQIRNFL